jgi:glycosyltransferase involved in cell wall biosynthesis
LVTHQENGFLISYGNFEELKDGINIVLHNTSLQEKFVKEGKRAVQRYSWDRLLQQTKKVLGSS